ncbi:MAG: glucose-6-phosphate isomerase [Bacteroidales bacterium]|nr:glucose-6-phosphate isomerase [Bacteroidales bacterium]
MKENISINLKWVEKYISYEEIAAHSKQAVRHLEQLVAGTGAGNDYLGWIKLPDNILSQIGRIEKMAKHLRSVSDTTVVVGIGGSYLGARAVIEALSHSFSQIRKEKSHQIIYAGHNVCEEYMAELLEILEYRNYSVIVISKSGTTMEPAIAFRLLKDHVERKYGKSIAADRIVAITDAKKGALRSLAELNGYETFEIPDDVGGRYSVLTPVGLLPIGVAGFDIKEIINGAKAGKELTLDCKNPMSNPALVYATTRNLLLRSGKNLEILVSFNPKLHYFAEWWKQLYGESEGKEGKGIFPASADFTTDLHSLGQYIQEGQRILFETILSVKSTLEKVKIPFEKDDHDQLNYLAGKQIYEVNKCAETGTIVAHHEGGVPVITLNIPAIDAYYIGQMIYFFEMACAISGYILDVNPFDQPGVEAYKKNMFALLNKPGYEEEGKKLREKIKK